MARINTPAVNTRKTHEGATAAVINASQELRRSVMANMLWEGEFYEDGQSNAKRIADLIPHVKPEDVAVIAVESREKMKLRHVPLLLVRELARGSKKAKLLVADTLERVIQRPDELSEFLAIYWKDGKDQSLSAQVKKGLARAFTKFNEYSLAKYNRDDAIKLRDVLFLSHAKPKDAEQESLWKRLVAGELATPDTWEVELSARAGEGKKESWERLLREEKLGALALLRNLRNMQEADVPHEAITAALAKMKVERVLPFRFIAAARYAPWAEPDLEGAMFKCVVEAEKLAGHTVLLVDISGSMSEKISAKSDMTRMDAACGLAILLRELCDRVSVYSFSDDCKTIPPRRGFALRDAIVGSQRPSGTYLGRALDRVHLDNSIHGYDRIIVITDEQTHDSVGAPLRGVPGYVINVASYKNGVGYGAWNHIDGWSEAVVDYIRAFEKEVDNER